MDLHVSASSLLGTSDGPRLSGPVVLAQLNYRKDDQAGVARRWHYRGHDGHGGRVRELP